MYYTYDSAIECDRHMILCGSLVDVQYISSYIIVSRLWIVMMAIVG